MAGKKKGRPDTKPSEGRDSQGRFAKGWKGGPGNPEFNRLREYRAAVEKEIPPNTCARILARFAIMAIQGDVPAGKVVLERLMGKPSANPSGATPTLQLAAPRTTEEAESFLRDVQDAYASGAIGDVQVSTHVQLVKAFSDLFAVKALRDRIRALEQRLDDEAA